MPHAERGLFELRQGRALCVTAPQAAVLIASVESLEGDTPQRLERWSGAPLRLVVTRHRAAAMGLVPHPDPDEPPDPVNGRRRDVSLALPAAAGTEQILRLAGASGKHAVGPVELRDATGAETAGLALARMGRLLPALVAAPVAWPPSPEVSRALEDRGVLRVSTEQIRKVTWSLAPRVTHVSEAPVPLEGAEDARFILFRESNGLFEHLAVLVGAPERWPDPVPLRLHSACITGDLFGSLRCDCGEQLRGSLAAFMRLGGGVLLYLAHEGRSIGLANKLRAYAMQEEGLDTVDADCALGFGADERCYQAAVEILRFLKVERVEILTNNPLKVQAMEQGGIQVAGRRALHGKLTPQNLPYVSAKAVRGGHWLEGMLSRRIPATE